MKRSSSRILMLSKEWLTLQLLYTSSLYKCERVRASSMFRIYTSALIMITKLENKIISYIKKVATVYICVGV